jgi:hypothetical protein
MGTLEAVSRTGVANVPVVVVPPLPAALPPWPPLDVPPVTVDEPPLDPPVPPRPLAEPPVPPDAELAPRRAAGHRVTRDKRGNALEDRVTIDYPPPLGRAECRRVAGSESGQDARSVWRAARATDPDRHTERSHQCERQPAISRQTPRR